MDKEELESYIKAGEIARKVKVFSRDYIKQGMRLIDIANAIDSKIKELGGKCAFPVNLSLNEIAAHYTPYVGDETIAEGLLKVDIGVHINGYIADTAFSIDLTPDKKFSDMIELNKKILDEVTKKVRPGMELNEVGEIVQNKLEEWNDKTSSRFSIIKSLSGHALGKDRIHAGITISNYRNENKTKLNEIAFAIEPFVTTGVGDVYEGKGGGIYVLQRDENVRDKDSREILKFIKEEYNTLPFCSRWLEAKGFKKINFSLNNLTKLGILYEYPLLIEKGKGPVSQEENTFIIHDEKVVMTTD